ncbi:MAG TPA: CYTH domain-containing protein, partial [Candidatus Dormibacteraeota bacterium]
MKLGAGPAFHLPDLNGVVDGVAVTPPEAVRLETVYYDTLDLRLARWGVSLRHRAGEGWTLKLPPKPGAEQPAGQMLERDELTFQGGSKRPPEAAVAIVRAYVRKAELVPVARLSTMRRRVRLVDAAGARVAEVVDDEVSVRDGRRVAARFREIEVEVMEQPDGADGIVDPLVLRLRGAGAGAPDPTPKHIRALGPRAMEPPEVAPQPVRPDSSARDVIKHVLAESIASLLRQDPLVRTSGDPEA